jgi:hypothetical protein
MADKIGVSLSEMDIKHMMNGKTKIIPYTDIYNYKTIDQLLSPYGHVFLLYLTKPNYGHWTLIFRYPHKREVHFFDSYGYVPDSEFSFVKDMQFRIKSKQIYHYLVHLLINSTKKYTVSYNHFQLQGHNKKGGRHIATCGRWCLARILNKNLDEYEFFDLFGGDDMNVDKDLLVTRYINI